MGVESFAKHLIFFKQKFTLYLNQKIYCMSHTESPTSLRNKRLCSSTEVSFFRRPSLEGTLSLLSCDQSLDADTETELSSGTLAT